MTAPPCCQRRILAADDCAASRQLIEAVLHSLGFAADCVPHGQAAIEALHQRPYDFVILDQEMPVVDGLAVAVEIATHWSETWPRPQVLALTADESEESRQRWLASGARACLHKPLTALLLRQVLFAAPSQIEAVVVGPEDIKRAGRYVDWDELEALHTHICPNGNHEPFHRIFNSFNRQITQALEALRASEPGTSEERRTLHQLKGLLGFMSMVRARDMVAKVYADGSLPLGPHRQVWIEDLMRVTAASSDDIATHYSTPMAS